MRHPTPYLKMRVLGAIDMAEGNSIHARIKAVSQMPFTDEDGHPRQFTWRTIQTWYSRYKKHGVTVMENKTRSDKGKTRKINTEDVQDIITTGLMMASWKRDKRSPAYDEKSETTPSRHRLMMRSRLLGNKRRWEFGQISKTPTTGIRVFLRCQCGR